MAIFKRKRKAKSLKRAKFSKPNLPAKPQRKTTGRSSIAHNKSPYRTETKLPKKRLIRTRRKYSGAIEPPARLKKTGDSKWKKIAVAILTLIIILGSAYLIFLTEYFEINEFEIYEDSTQITNNLELNALLDQELQEKNVLLFNHNKLKQQILTRFPEFDSLKVRKVPPKTIRIDLKRFPQSANIINIIRSDDGIPIQKRYVVNSQGMIIVQDEENPELPYIQIESTEAFQLGDNPITQERLDYITTTIDLFEEKIGIQVIDAIFLKKARELHLRTVNDFTVWFDINYTDQANNMIPQIDKLKKALPKLDIYNTPLQYIDLRISGTNAEKVIFKRR